MDFQESANLGHGTRRPRMEALASSARHSKIHDQSAAYRAAQTFRDACVAERLRHRSGGTGGRIGPPASFTVREDTGSEASESRRAGEATSGTQPDILNLTK